MIAGKTNAGNGDPLEPGIYACEVYHGWKLLEWGPCDMWFHVGLQAGKYPLEVVQWVGPLPAEIYWQIQDDKIAKTEKVFDL